MNESESPNPTGHQHLELTSRFTGAVEYARQLHKECRKGTKIPYMAHLFGVAALVMGEAGGPVPVTENMVIAAILHDAVEDHGGKLRLDDIQQEFGADVARMVAALSDSFVEDSSQKADWRTRKCAYLDHLRHAPNDVLLISAADKLYNAKAILDDYNAIGAAIWSRFKVGADEQLWYFDALLANFKARHIGRIVNEFETVVRGLRRAVSIERSESRPGGKTDS